ncbi:MAG TPA: hypothetical protein VGI19_02735 [Candidatus Cybelea sp.]|jgi:hypothetical protein
MTTVLSENALATGVLLEAPEHQVDRLTEELADDYGTNCARHR